MQVNDNNNGQQNNAPSKLFLSGNVSPDKSGLQACNVGFISSKLLSPARRGIKVRFEKLAFDAQEPHEVCYEQSTVLETNDILQQIKGKLELLNEETCFLLNEVTLLEHLQSLPNGL